ncbi:MAG: SURF1 family protein [Rhizobiaceae bacterium]|nr:SURF1 family protein [Rhizobiaceae bacterium]
MTVSAARSGKLPVLLSAAVVLAVLIGLGTWQVQRLVWKEALLANIQQRISSPPRSLSEIEAQLETTGDVDYVPVRLSGTFAHDSERFFFATWEGKTGFYVYTPFRVTDGRYVFVNRGFVPYEMKDPGTRLQGQVSGQVHVTGLARNRLDEKPGKFVPDNDVAKNIFYWKDLTAMEASANLPAESEVLPFFVDADQTPNPGGWPRGGVTMVDLPNNHLQYAVTWYGLAAALISVVGVWLNRQRAART